jgi:hypothetical protein
MARIEAALTLFPEIKTKLLAHAGTYERLAARPNFARFWAYIAEKA